MSKILIIDDSELVATMLQKALTQQGFTVELAMDANQGYQAAIEFSPDLILLDVQLPDIVGFDLINIIKNREELKHTPIIMITGSHHQTEDKVKAFQSGADDYVLKPFEMPELIERIRAVLRRSEARVVAPPQPAASVAKPQPSAAPKPAPVREQKPMISLKETLRRAMLLPETLKEAELPPVVMLYVGTLLGLSLGGWALSSGSTVKPALIGLGMPGFWGLCVAVLVMTCSIMGISLTWKEGARLMCVAGLPLLLKLLGGCVMTLLTSLTPFYFTASPDIFFKSGNAVLERLDVFELWTVWLVWMLVKSCKGCTKQKAWVAALIVWPVIAYWQSLWKH